MPFKPVGIDENSRFPDRVQEQLSTTIDGKIAAIPESGAIAGSHTITDATIAKAPRATLQVIPTYDGSGVAVHPSVYFNPEGFAGSKYWMAFTPYSSATVALENPSIVRSDDGNTWTVPAGLTNPVEPPYSPEGQGYNSDPYLFVDGLTMYLFWRTWDGVAQRDRHYYRTSLDGVTWTARVMVRDDVATTRRIVSPSYVKNRSGWTMFGVDIVQTPRRIVRVQATTLAGMAAATVTNVTVTGNAGEPWHMDAHRVGGEWQILVVDGGSGGGDLWAAVSNDGLNFKAGPSLIARTSGAWDAVYYKSCFVPAVRNGLAGWDTWIGGGQFVASGNIIGRTFVRFDTIAAEIAAKDSLIATMQTDVEMLKAKSGLSSSLLAYDDFNRVDAVGLGTSPTGLVWSAGFQVVGNKATASAAANERVFLTLATADHAPEILATGAAGSQHWVMARFTDAGNYWRFGNNGGDVIRLEKLVAGALAEGYDLGQRNAAVATRFTLYAKGAAITASVNGAVVKTATEGTVTTGTGVGIQSTTTASRFDDFKVLTP